MLEMWSLKVILLITKMVHIIITVTSFGILKASQGIYLASSSCISSSTVQVSLKFVRGRLNAECFVVLKSLQLNLVSVMCGKPALKKVVMRLKFRRP